MSWNPYFCSGLGSKTSCRRKPPKLPKTLLAKSALTRPSKRGFACTYLVGAKFSEVVFGHLQKMSTLREAAISIVFRIGENQKGTAGRGREKNVTTICEKRHDSLRHFMGLGSNLLGWGRAPPFLWAWARQLRRRLPWQEVRVLSKRLFGATSPSRFWSCVPVTSPRKKSVWDPSLTGQQMAWQTVSRKGGGKGWNQGMENQLLQSMTAMQNSITQLAQSLQTQPPPGRKGQEKGKTPKGQGKGNSTSPGERKNPNLKPFSERATPTTEEIKCPNCPAYSCTMRSVGRTCGHNLPPGSSNKALPSQKNPGQASAKQGGGGLSSSVVSSGASSATVAKGETGPVENPKEENDT